MLLYFMVKVIYKLHSVLLFRFLVLDIEIGFIFIRFLRPCRKPLFFILLLYSFFQIWAIFARTRCIILVCFDLKTWIFILHFFYRLKLYWFIFLILIILLLRISLWWIVIRLLVSFKKRPALFLQLFLLKSLLAPWHHQYHR